MWRGIINWKLLSQKMLFTNFFLAIYFHLLKTCHKRYKIMGMCNCAFTFSARQVDLVDPDQTAPKSDCFYKQYDQGLYCLPFCLHLMDTLPYVKTTPFKFKNYKILGVIVLWHSYSRIMQNWRQAIINKTHLQISKLKSRQSSMVRTFCLKHVW